MGFKCQCLAFVLIFTALVVVGRDIETTNGEVYKNAEVIQKKSNGLDIVHSSGATFIEFKNLPEELQKEFGYDPKKAEEEAKRKEAIRQEAIKKAAKRQEAIREKRKLLRSQKYVLRGKENLWNITKQYEKLEMSIEKEKYKKQLRGKSIFFKAEVHDISQWKGNYELAIKPFIYTKIPLKKGIALKLKKNMKLIVVGKLKGIDVYKSYKYGGGQYSQVFNDSSIYLINPDATIAKIVSLKKLVINSSLTGIDTSLMLLESRWQEEEKKEAERKKLQNDRILNQSMTKEQKELDKLARIIGGLAYATFREHFLDQATKIKNGPTGATKLKYYSLRNGISLSEAMEVMGYRGRKELSRTGSGRYETVTYQWKASSGNGWLYIILQDGKLVSKRQFGLK